MSYNSYEDLGSSFYKKLKSLFQDRNSLIELSKKVDFT
jgi:hypothetical protein